MSKSYLTSLSSARGGGLMFRSPRDRLFSGLTRWARARPSPRPVIVSTRRALSAREWRWEITGESSSRRWDEGGSRTIGQEPPSSPPGRRAATGFSARLSSPAPWGPPEATGPALFLPSPLWGEGGQRLPFLLREGGRGVRLRPALQRGANGVLVFGERLREHLQEQAPGHPGQEPVLDGERGGVGQARLQLVGVEGVGVGGLLGLSRAVGHGQAGGGQVAL